MTDAVTKLVREWRADKLHAVGNLAERLRCADDLAKLNREVIEPGFAVVRDVEPMFETFVSEIESIGMIQPEARNLLVRMRTVLSRYYGAPGGISAQDSY